MAAQSPVAPDVRHADFVAITARIDQHGLIGAECAALTGGTPDADGVAACTSVDLIERAAYVKLGVRVLARAPTFEALVVAVGAADFDAERFRVDVHDPAGRIEHTDVETAVALANVMVDRPDLAEPLHRFVVVAHRGGHLFGEVIVVADGSYRRHDTKPWTTSSSLDSRFARGLVNLVPGAHSILDPCCGAGSIVIEAASLGLDAFGVDWKPAMAGMTRENLAHFGYVAGVDQADSRTHRRCVDAVVTDLPYGRAIAADEHGIRAIIERAATLAATGVFVAPTDITNWMSAAGFVDVQVFEVTKRRGFTRWVHVGRSQAVR
jgi:tRNA G10  N-methylase Trm11